MSGVLRRNVLFCLNFLLLAPLGAATLMGFAGAYGWVLDLFSHFRVQYCVIAVVLCLLLAILRAGRPAAVAGLILVVNLVPVVLLYLPQRGAVAVAAEAPKVFEQRLLMMNVYRNNPGIQRILNYIRRENPDVLVLEEVTQTWVGPLKTLESRYPFRWVHPGNAHTGIAVFSRSMPLETRLIDTAGVAGKPSLLLTLGVGPEDRRLSILCTHLYSPTGPTRARLRDRELESVARVAREHIWPLIVIGDINVSQFSPLFERTLSDGGLKSCDRGGLHPTWPSWAPPLGIQIDHCLATEGVHTSDFRVGPSLGSDHRAISVKFSPAMPLLGAGEQVGE